MGMVGNRLGYPTYVLQAEAFSAGHRFMGKEAVNGNISGYWVWKHLMNQLCWQHAKIISPNKMSIAKPMKVELTWILFIGLKHFEL